MFRYFFSVFQNLLEFARFKSQQKNPLFAKLRLMDEDYLATILYAVDEEPPEEQLVVAQRPVPDGPVEYAMPDAMLKTTIVLYRSTGCGVWGVLLRYCGMPLEKIALFANSSMVTPGKNQLREAVRLTFAQGFFAPYRVVGSASIVAWFLQYSSMSFVFQLADAALSHSFGLSRVPYGEQVFNENMRHHTNPAKDMAAATIAGVVESAVSNRAEVQRYYGLQTFAKLQETNRWGVLGPAFLPNASRNAIMAYSAFVMTPVLYHDSVPQDYKSSSSLFFFGLSVNMFLGNGIAVTQQALWGRTLDALRTSSASYRTIIADGWRQGGLGAFLTPSKWFTRILMNAPAEGTSAGSTITSSPSRNPPSSAALMASTLKLLLRPFRCRRPSIVFLRMNRDLSFGGDPGQKLQEATTRGVSTILGEPWLHDTLMEESSSKRRCRQISKLDGGTSWVGHPGARPSGQELRASSLDVHQDEGMRETLVARTEALEM